MKTIDNLIFDVNQIIYDYDSRDDNIPATIFADEISLSELVNNIQSWKSGEAPGPDGIFVEMLKSSVAGMAPYL